MSHTQLLWRSHVLRRYSSMGSFHRNDGQLRPNSLVLPDHVRVSNPQLLAVCPFDPIDDGGRVLPDLRRLCFQRHGPPATRGFGYYHLPARNLDRRKLFALEKECSSSNEHITSVKNLFLLRAYAEHSVLYKKESIQNRFFFGGSGWTRTSDHRGISSVL